MQPLPASGATPAESIEPKVSWSTVDAIVVLVGAFVVYVVGSVVIAAVAYAAQGGVVGFWVIPVSYLFLSGGVVFMVAWWLMGRRKATWREIGFRMPYPSIGASIARIALVAIAAFILVQVGATVISGIFDLTGFHIKSNVKELLPRGQTHIDLAQYLTLVAVGAILAPITEEVLFRGVLYQAMRRDMARLTGSGSIASIAVAAVVSGFLFGGFHLIGGSGELHTLPVLVYLGILLAITFQVARSLGGSILVHAAVNFASISYLFAQAH
jgi:membrane protease YdiL (CAAX protease family)